MSDTLPSFTYHPNPISTGSVERSAGTCRCCGQARGYIYVGPVYGLEDLHDSLCPWCIADGSAARALGAEFADARPLKQAGVAAAVTEEVHLRTPGYSSWQSEQWLVHCGDACEFHGRASPDELASAGVVPRGLSAPFKFKCRHCATVLFAQDLS